MDTKSDPVKLLSDFLDTNNLVLKLTPLAFKPLGNGTMLVEPPQILVGNKEEEKKVEVAQEVKSNKHE